MPMSIPLGLLPGVQGLLKATAMDKAYQSAHAAIKRYRWQGSTYESKIHCLFGDSATFDYSPFYGKVDLFFVDGVYSYEYVRSDTINAFKCINQGVVLWHDYGRMGINGVSKWSHELARTKKIFSVPGSSLAHMIVD